MDSRSLEGNDILKNVGGSEQNSLKNILQENDADFEIDTIGSSLYYSLENLPTDIKDDGVNFLALCLNTQSIFAK